ncbi:hypothetical protein MHB77_30150 [Paenibacillus sp. FSL K6-3166]|uniref:hypothetical protein n=1 Tax=Paenibacillus sp. FSL K6-3166 TaxID=2921492 RepID=UPI0030F9DABD
MREGEIKRMSAPQDLHNFELIPLDYLIRNNGENHFSIHRGQTGLEVHEAKYDNETFLYEGKYYFVSDCPTYK